MKHLKRFLLLLIAFLVLCLALGELFYQIDQRTQDQS